MPWPVLVVYAELMAEALEEERLRAHFKSSAMLEEWRRKKHEWLAIQPPPQGR